MLEAIVRTTRQLSITLPNDMADALRERVRSGAYASESEVISEGLRALFARDQAVDTWLHEEVGRLRRARRESRRRRRGRRRPSLLSHKAGSARVKE